MAAKKRRKKVKATSTAPAGGTVKATSEAPSKKKAAEAMDDFLAGPGRPGRKKRSAKPKVSHTDDAWGEVIDTIFDLDPVTLTDRLTKEIQLGLFVSDFGHLREALDRAADNLYQAKRLERASKLELKRFEDEQAHEMELLRTSAREDLKKTRQRGEGAITKQVIEDYLTAHWPDKVSAYRKRHRRLHNATRALEGLTEAWNHRNSQLKTILERASLGRPRGGGQ